MNEISWKTDSRYSEKFIEVKIGLVLILSV